MAGSTGVEVRAPGTGLVGTLAASCRLPLAPGLAQAAERELTALRADAEHGARAAVVERLAALLAAEGARGPARAPGRAEELDAYSAALLTGVAARAGSRLGSQPTGLAVMAAVLAVAQELGSGQTAQVGAYALGRELELRLAEGLLALPGGRRWDLDGACGPVGAAVACASLAGSESLDDAAGAAASMSLGHLEARSTDAWRLHAGWAAAAGVLASRLAQGGLSACGDLLRAPRGWLAVLGAATGATELAAAAAIAEKGAGDRWRLERSA